MLLSLLSRPAPDVVDCRRNAKSREDLDVWENESELLLALNLLKADQSSKYAAMQREIDDLRRQLKVATESNASASGRLVPGSSGKDHLSEVVSSTKSR